MSILNRCSGPLGAARLFTAPLAAQGPGALPPFAITLGVLIACDTNEATVRRLLRGADLDTLRARAGVPPRVPTH